MQKKVFIHTNNKQYLGALLSKYSIERKLPKDTDITVHIINVDEMNEFKNFAGKTYLRGGSIVTYDPLDLQSFTLSRFTPPEQMNFEGRAIVIDPDIFAIQDITPLMDMDLEGKAIAACKKGDVWQSSSMLLDCAKLTHWKIVDMLSKLEKKEIDYKDIMGLKKETSIKEIPSVWNSLDILVDETKLLHTTNRLTQPWRTGLPIDFTRSPMPKLFGIIPRELIHKLLGKYPMHYQKHPDSKIENFFIQLTTDSIKDGVLSENDIEKEISRGHVRKDMIKLIKGNQAI